VEGRRRRRGEVEGVRKGGWVGHETGD